MIKKNLMDVVFINPSVGKNYQKLKSRYTTIEPPTWSLLLAQSMRNFGFNISIIDANAESISEEEIYNRITNLNPRLIVFVVYGQNVNAGTTNMEGAIVLK
jgi:anaerobic magnesium-protoporphyrin IX monomethyl ester cyclase